MLAVILVSSGKSQALPMVRAKGQRPAYRNRNLYARPRRVKEDPKKGYAPSAFCQGIRFAARYALVKLTAT